MTEFDVVLTDTCLGGSTVAARMATPGSGYRAFYLADFAINPLGVKTRDEVRAVLERWLRVAAARAGTLVVACNTASVLLVQSPDLLATAGGEGLRVWSMVDLLDRALAEASSAIDGKRVCLMGTRFTVAQPVYGERLVRAGAAEVLPLAATRTERTIAHLRHLSDEGRQDIVDEIGETIRQSDVVVLACTLFPLVGALVREINPGCVIVDPAAGVAGLLAGGPTSGTNRLTLAVTGTSIALDEVRKAAPALFPGWVIESIESDAGLESGREPPAR